MLYLRHLHLFTLKFVHFSKDLVCFVLLALVRSWSSRSYGLCINHALYTSSKFPISVSLKWIYACRILQRFSNFALTFIIVTCTWFDSSFFYWVLFFFPMKSLFNLYNYFLEQFPFSLHLPVSLVYVKLPCLLMSYNLNVSTPWRMRTAPHSNRSMKLGRRAAREHCAAWAPAYDTERRKATGSCCGKVGLVKRQWISKIESWIFKMVFALGVLVPKRLSQSRLPEHLNFSFLCCQMKNNNNNNT